MWCLRFSCRRVWKWPYLWDVTPCSLVEIDRCFRGAYCLWNVGYFYERTRCNILEDSHLRLVSWSCVQINKGWDRISSWSRSINSKDNSIRPRYKPRTRLFTYEMAKLVRLRVLANSDRHLQATCKKHAAFCHFIICVWRINTISGLKHCTPKCFSINQ